MHHVVQAPTLDDIFKRYDEIFAGIDDDDDEDVQVPMALQEANKMKSELREAIHQLGERKPQVRLPQDKYPTESDVSSGSALRSVKGKVQRSRRGERERVCQYRSPSFQMSNPNMFRHSLATMAKYHEPNFNRVPRRL